MQNSRTEPHSSITVRRFRKQKSCCHVFAIPSGWHRCPNPNYNASLLSSYLTNRKQSVTINNYCSTPLNINNGVPQGSTLGPLLFFIYINDLESSILINPRLFADDTYICINADTISNLEYLINSKLLRVNNWLNANKLILNALKSKGLIIPPKTRY